MIQFLIDNRTQDFIPEKVDGQFSFLKDENFSKFIKEFNGGYFFRNSLHLFGMSSKYIFHDLEYRNNFFEMNYGNLMKNLFFFGEDLFGNGFAFKGNSICLFNIETADCEMLAENFEDWIDLLKKDFEYLTGYSCTRDLSSNELKKLSKGYRLAAKFPFVLGGEYDAKNLILKKFEENLEYNSAIAKQIRNLPDGSKFTINIE